MTTQQLADRLVELLRAGDYETIFKELISKDIINAEPEGSEWGTVQGIEAVLKKGEQFESMVETMHSTEVSDPIVAENFIALTMKMNVTFKDAPAPTQMDEVCVYEVNEGKIVKEQFFYTPPPKS